MSASALGRYAPGARAPRPGGRGGWCGPSLVYLEADGRSPAPLGGLPRRVMAPCEASCTHLQAAGCLLAGDPEGPWVCAGARSGSHRQRAEALSYFRSDVRSLWITCGVSPSSRVSRRDVEVKAIAPTPTHFPDDPSGVLPSSSGREVSLALARAAKFSYSIAIAISVSRAIESEVNSAAQRAYSAR
jgi:hypothetical protein